MVDTKVPHIAPPLTLQAEDCNECDIYYKCTFQDRNDPDIFTKIQRVVLYIMFVLVLDSSIHTQLNGFGI